MKQVTQSHGKLRGPKHGSFLKTACLAAAFATAALFGTAGTASATNLTHVKTVSNTDWTSAGVGGMRNYGYGTLNVAGITGTVKSAMLYWNGPTSSSDPLANASVMFAGNPIMGTNIGFSSDNCWGYQNSQAYRADVTEFVTGNGFYALTGFGKDTDYRAPDAINTNGASLVVFYDDGDDTNNRDVAVFSGNDSNINNSYDAPGWNFTLSPINYTRGIGTLQMHVADGQRWIDGAVYVNNRQIAARGAIFEGDSVPSNNTGPFGYGHLWDIRDFDVTEDLVANPNSLQVTSGVYNDCLGGIVMIVDLPLGAAPPPENPINNPPVADAGKDGTIKAGASTKLDGTQSYDSDPDDGIMAYGWSLIAGAPVSISGADTATPTITANPDLGDMTATFELEVTDKGGLTNTATVMITIVKNSPPVADAGADQTKDEGVLVTLNGTKSKDPDIGDSLSYSWTQTGGPAVALSDTSSATPDFPAPSVATCTPLAFQLMVTDDDNPSGANPMSDSDDVVITVCSLYDAMQCNVARAEPGILWPPNHKYRQINITGMPEDATITVTGITQDEPTNGLGDGDTGPDGRFDNASVQVRAERSGLEDGRVYVIGYTADNGFDTCHGTVSVGVPHDKRGDPAIDSGQDYDSTILTSPITTASNHPPARSKKKK